MINVIKNRIDKEGVGNVQSLVWKGDNYLLITGENIDGTLLVTQGLSEFDMPVPENYKEEKNIECYFLIPKYWDLNSTENPHFEWLLATLKKIKEHIKNNQWVVSGHTFNIPDLPEGKLKDAAFSSLLVVSPIETKILSNPIEFNTKKIIFRALVPVFKDEKDYNEARGLHKLLKIFLDKNISEKIDEFRFTSVRHRFLFWF